jgi:hypothetical protein
MPLRCAHAACPNSEQRLPYLPTMCMGNYLRFVVAPAFGLEEADDTVLAKVHTPDLRVVFNGACSGRQLRELLEDDARLVISPWNAKDPSTTRSLLGNVRILSSSGERQ